MLIGRSLDGIHSESDPTACESFGPKRSQPSIEVGVSGREGRQIVERPSWGVWDIVYSDSSYALVAV